MVTLHVMNWEGCSHLKRGWEHPWLASMQCTEKGVPTLNMGGSDHGEPLCTDDLYTMSTINTL